MDVRIGSAEFDGAANPVYFGFAEFDVIGSLDVHFGWCEFDCGDNSDSAAVVGGRGTPLRTSFKSVATAAPVTTPSRYHERHDDADALAAAAELDDEETVLVLLMEIFTHAV